MEDQILGDNETVGVEKVQFTELTEAPAKSKIDQNILKDIPVEATVELGKTKMALREIIDLADGSIIELDRVAGEPLDIRVGGQVVAQGEVVVVDDYYGIRVTKVLLK